MKTFKTVEEIRTERQAQRENKVIYSLLGVLLGELDRRPNQNIPVTEGDIYKTIKKLHEAAIECGNTEEKEYLQEFIKKQLSSVELTMIIERAVKLEGINKIGLLMGYLAKNYPDQYDAKTAAVVARKFLG